MAEYERKNRRYVGAKFSEYRLKKVVDCFAREVSVKDTAEATRLSENTVAVIFMRIRERLYQYGFMRVQRDPSKPPEIPAKFVFRRKLRGAPEKYHLLYEAEFLHRVILGHNTKRVEKLSASNPDDVKRARSLERYNETQHRYNLIEMRPSAKAPDGTEQRPFEAGDYDPRSTILINRGSAGAACSILQLRLAAST